MVRGPSRSKSELVIKRCGLLDRVVEEDDPFNEELLDRALNQANGTKVPEDWIKESRFLLEASLS